MSDSTLQSRLWQLRILIAGGVTTLLAIAVVGFLVYSTVCPCDRLPGGYLMGETAEEPIRDWRFANDVPLCQMQIFDGLRPHSVNLNCMATPDGNLYLSCSACGTAKYWGPRVGPNERGVMRLDGVVYPVVLNRVLDPEEIDRAWAARVAKLQVHGGGPYNPIPDPEAERPGHWWTFHVTSRS